MLHALAVLFFIALLLGACVSIDMLVRANWPAIKAAFMGLDRQ